MSQIGNRPNPSIIGGKVPDPKKPVVPKKGPRALRKDMIKDLLKAHLRTARDAYWNSIKKESKTVILPRPTAQALADQLKQIIGKSVDQSTINQMVLLNQKIRN